MKSIADFQDLSLENSKMSKVLGGRLPGGEATGAGVLVRGEGTPYQQTVNYSADLCEDGEGGNNSTTYYVTGGANDPTPPAEP